MNTLQFSFLVFSFFLSNFLKVNAQVFPKVKQSAPLLVPVEKVVSRSILKSQNASADSLMKPYLKFQQILRYHDPILYITFKPQFSPIKSRMVPLADGEGLDGYWLEGNVAHRINLYKGKYYSRAFFKKLRATFDAGFNLRLTADDSSPLLPTSNVIGLGMDYLITPIEQILKIGKLNLWVRGQIHHHSNGQASSFFQSFSPRRNNYKSGDFSTNYFRVALNALKQNKSDNLISVAFGYQREIDIGGPLILSNELEKSFGLNRLLMNFQWTRTPYYTLRQEGKQTIYENKRIQMNFRSEMIYIMDKDLSLYPSNNKYRIAAHNYFTVYPWLTNDVGFVFHNYIGRDYLNIRYDDVVNSYQLGLVLNFNK